MTLERVLLAGGGTAGHVLPLLATVQEITDRHTEAVITVVGSPDGIEERLVPVPADGTDDAEEAA